jgi:hypothetical protein
MSVKSTVFWDMTPCILAEKALQARQWDGTVGSAKPKTCTFIIQYLLHPVWIRPSDLFQFLTFEILNRTYTWQKCLEGGSTRRKSCAAQNKNTKTNIPRVRYQPAIPVFSWLKAAHTSDVAAADEAEFSPESCSHQRCLHVQMRQKELPNLGS